MDGMIEDSRARQPMVEAVPRWLGSLLRHTGYQAQSAEGIVEGHRKDTLQQVRHEAEDSRPRSGDG